MDTYQPKNTIRYNVVISIREYTDPLDGILVICSVSVQDVISGVTRIRVGLRNSSGVFSEIKNMNTLKVEPSLLKSGRFKN